MSQVVCQIHRVAGAQILEPMSDDDAEKIAKWEGVTLTAKQARNYRFHKKFFALIKTLMDRCEMFQEDGPTRTILQERWLTYLLIGAGQCDTFVTTEGEMYRVRKSISFASMDADEFNTVYSDALTVAVRAVPDELGQQLLVEFA